MLDQLHAIAVAVEVVMGDKPRIGGVAVSLERSDVFEGGAHGWRIVYPYCGSV